MPPALWEYFELENFLFILLLPKKKKKKLESGINLSKVQE